MTNLTDAARESLRAQLAALDAAEKAIETARKPFDDALNGVRDARDLLLEPFDGEYWTCEGCGKLILGCEPGYRDGGEDNLVFCPDCAPTYGDWKEAVEGRAGRLVAEGDAEEIDADHEALRQIAAHLESGGSLSDKLPARPL